MMELMSKSTIFWHAVFLWASGGRIGNMVLTFIPGKLASKTRRSLIRKLGTERTRKLSIWTSHRHSIFLGLHAAALLGCGCADVVLAAALLPLLVIAAAAAAMVTAAATAAAMAAAMVTLRLSMSFFRRDVLNRRRTAGAL